MKKTFTKEQLPEIAQEILRLLQPSHDSLQTDKATIVALSGDLGAGKTSLTQAIARELGVTEHLVSPTFVIMKSYSISPTTSYKLKATTLIHIDAYRLKSADELLKLGWQELITNPQNLILIEWPEQVPGIIPDYSHTVILTHIDEKTRSIDMQ